MTVTKQQALETTIARVKREILEAMEEGWMPESVRSFSELHDHCDANEFGGLCEEGFEFEQFFSFDEEGMNLVNEMQSAVDAWLKAGVTATRCDVCDGFVDLGDEPGRAMWEGGAGDVCSVACTEAFYAGLED